MDPNAPRGTLLLIHAFPLNARMWEPQLALAANGWRVIVPHLRGMDGGSTDPAAASMDDYAGDIIDLLDALHVHEAVDRRAVDGRLRRRSRCSATRRDTSGVWCSPTRARRPTRRKASRAGKMHGAVRETRDLGALPTIWIRSSLARRRAPSGRTSPSRSARSFWRTRRARHRRRNHRADDPADSTPLLASIHCPTLIVVGEEDAMTPPPLSEQHAPRALAAPSSLPSRRQGTCRTSKQPAAFNAALGSFLEHRV